jgi:two-component system sensor histidine kinase AlgZ
MSLPEPKRSPRISLRSWIAVLFVWNPAITIAIDIALRGRDAFGPPLVVGLVISTSAALVSLCGVALMQIADNAWQRRGGRAPQRRGRGVTFVQAILLMPLGMSTGFRLAGWVAPLVGSTFHTPDAADWRFGALLGVLISGLFFLWLMRVDATEAARTSELRLRDAENQRLVAQLDALTARMNPHLLFNALNTVAALIHHDPDGAEQTLLRLSDLYRGVLAVGGANTHALAEELRLCRAYLDVERARFGDRLRTRVEVDEEAAAQVLVPILLLQPLVENAVRHGLSSRMAGEVAILGRREADRMELVVEDDGVGPGGSALIGAGTAVATCRERLRLRYGESAALSIEARAGGGARVVIRFPVSSGGV